MTDLLDLQSRVRAVTGRLLAGLDTQFVGPLRKQDRAPSLDKLPTELAAAVGCVYALTSFAVLAVVQLLEGNDPLTSIVVVPSYNTALLHHIRALEDDRFWQEDPPRTRVHMRDLEDSSRKWAFDHYQLSKNKSIDKIDTIFTHAAPDWTTPSQALDWAAKQVTEYFGQSAQNRLAYLNDEVYLPWPAHRAGWYSTGRFFVETGAQCDAARCLVFYSPQERAQDSLRDGPLKIITVSLGKTLEEAVKGFPEEARWKDDLKWTDLVRPYLLYLRAALGLTDDTEKEEFYRTLDRVDQKASEAAKTALEKDKTALEESPCKTMSAVSCYDPLVGRADGTLVIYSTTPFRAETYAGIAQIAVPILTELGRIEEFLTAYRRQLSFRRRERLAGIMGRNLSHHIGSHVLADARLFDSVGLGQRELGLVGDAAKCLTWEADRQKLANVTRSADQLGVLLHYLQARLDFIAGLLHGEEPPPEPLFLVRDVLADFVRQSIILDRLVSDATYRAENIAFRVTYGEKVLTLEWNRDERRHVPSEADPPDDPLVAVPGGFSGRHALYSFLENVLRNAAKWGKPTQRDDGLKVFLELQECEARSLRTRDADAGRDLSWKLVVSENLSTGDGCVEKVRQALQEDVLQATSHGAMEMRRSAEYLAGRLRFADGEPLLPRPVQVVRDEKNWLGYELVLQKPILLGVVQSRTQAGCSPDGTVWWFHSVQALAGRGAYFGLIVDPGSEESRKHLLQEIQERHQSLPFRLAVVTSEPEAWTDLLGQSGAASLPPRRLHLLHENELPWLKNGRSPDGAQPGDWYERILGVYAAWLRVFKPLPEGQRWTLIVGFDEKNPGASTAADKWKTRVETLAERKPGVRVQVYLLGSRDPCHADTHTGDPVESQTAIKLAHHGKGIPPADGEPFALQEVGHNQGISLFETLCHPPAAGFSFAFFIHALIEAYLTDVVVLDERVAASTLSTSPKDKPMLFGDRQTSYRSARLYAALSTTFREQQVWVSPEIECAATETETGFPSWGKLKQGEGVNLDQGTVVCGYKKGSNVKLDEKTGVDVLVVHEGVAERVRAASTDQSSFQECFSEKLYAVAPHVVRTSGRGAKARALDERIPFLEFSAVSGATFRSLDKYRLARALLATQCPGGR